MPLCTVTRSHKGEIIALTTAGKLTKIPRLFPDILPAFPLTDFEFHNLSRFPSICGNHIISSACLHKAPSHTGTTKFATATLPLCNNQFWS